MAAQVTWRGVLLAEHQQHRQGPHRVQRRDPVAHRGEDLLPQGVPGQAQQPPLGAAPLLPPPALLLFLQYRRIFDGLFHKPPPFDIAFVILTSGFQNYFFCYYNRISWKMQAPASYFFSHPKARDGNEPLQERNPFRPGPRRATSPYGGGRVSPAGSGPAPRWGRVQDRPKWQRRPVRGRAPPALAHPSMRGLSRLRRDWGSFLFPFPFSPHPLTPSHASTKRGRIAPRHGRGSFSVSKGGLRAPFVSPHGGEHSPVPPPTRRGFGLGCRLGRS